MKWNRVLNSFIVLFIAINLFLFGVGKLTEETPNELSPQRISQLSRVLSEEQVSLYDNYPVYSPKSPLEARIQKFDEPAVATLVIGEAFNIRESEVSIDYVTDRGKLVFYKDFNSGSFVYSTEQPEYLMRTSDIDQLIKESKKWIDRLLGKNKVYETFLIQGDAADLTIEFHQVYDEEIVYFNTVKLKFNEVGLTEALIRNFEIVGFTGAAKPLKPVDEVLYKFIDDMKEQTTEPIIISTIRIGYEFGPESTDSIDGMIESIPYYIIKLSNGDVYYIDAYTNENRTI